MSVPMPPPRLRDALEPWCAAGATGAMRVLDAPGGAVYIVDGQLAYAESPVVSGVDRLLTASGRLPAESWRAALAAGRQQYNVGAELVRTGLLSRAEFEAVTLLALHDAAYFLFDAAVLARFEPGVRHLLGATPTLDLLSVCREVDRRKRVLADAWPDASIDTSAVLPSRRLPGQFVALGPLQWEVVANADRRRSPIDLARLLGRDTFSTMLAVRRLARAGLVEPGRPAGSAATESVATVRARAAVPRPAMGAPVLRHSPRPPAPEPALEPRDPAPPDRQDAALPELPRRVAAAQPDAPAPQYEPPCSEELLLRLRAGLAALP